MRINITDWKLLMMPLVTRGQLIAGAWVRKHRRRETTCYGYETQLGHMFGRHPAGRLPR